MFTPGTGGEFVSGDATRLRLRYTGDTPEDDVAFFREGVPTAANAEEMRLDMSNGDQILFRRNGAFEAGNFAYVGRRVLVPVAQVFASGYRINYHYPDLGIYPDRISDSFGREFLITWSTDDAPVVEAITLPDQTRLEYSYGQPTTGQKRLEGVARKSTSGDLLWGRTYHHEDSRFPFSLTGISDQLGQRIATYAYDAGNRVTLSEAADGANRVSVGYFEDSNELSRLIRKVTNPLGLEQTYEFVRNPQATSNTPAVLTSVTTTATANVPAMVESVGAVDGLQAAQTDPNGNTTTQVNDPVNKRPTSITDATGLVTQLTWHPTLDLIAGTQRPGLDEQFTYDTNGRMLTKTEIDQSPTATNGTSRTTSFNWAPTGRLLSINGPRQPDAQGRDDVTSFAYNAAGNLVSTTNPMGHVTSFAGHDANGNPAEMTDANGVKTQFTYDALGRLASSTGKHPTDATKDAITSFDYDIEGRITGITRPETVKLLLDYDLAGRLLAVRTPDGERIDYAYDAMGNVLSETAKRTDGTTARAVSRTFDELGRMLSEALGADRITRWSYDNNGNPVQVTTPRGNNAVQAFDPLDRLVTVTAPAAGTQTATYDALDNVSTFRDANFVETTFTRNGFGEVLVETSPDRGTTTYTYDPAGDVVSSTDGRGIEVRYTRDIMGRITRKVPTGRTAEAIRYDWDLPDTETTWRIGRLTRVTDASGVSVFNYDHRGNLTAKRFRPVGTTEWMWLRYAYDLADRIVWITYPSGRQVIYVRDTKGRITSVRTRTNASETTWTSLAAGMTYEAFGSLKTANFGNGLRLLNNWGDDGRLVAKRLFRPTDGTSVSRLTYVYDTDDNIVRINDLVDPTRTLRYTYDAAGRVSRVDRDASVFKRVNYTHDDNGNRLREIRRVNATDATPAESDIYSYEGGTNRLASVTTPSGVRTIAVDGRGNMQAETRPGSVAISTTYDGYGRLTGYARTGDPTQANVYNGLDDRVAVTSGTQTRRYMFDTDGRVLGEYGATTSDVVAEFIWMSPEVTADGLGGDDGTAGYAPLAVASGPVTSPSLLWVHGGHLGVPLAYTTASGSAGTVGDWQVPGFPGQSRTFADLYYNRYRDYDPSTGRYIQADPIGLAGDVNPFVYAVSNPVNRIDPLGLESPTYDAGGRWRSNLRPDVDPFSDLIEFVAGDYITAFEEPTLKNVVTAIACSLPIGKGGKIIKRFNPFRGKSAKQIDKLFRRKGFKSMGPDPLNGRGTYVHPKSGRAYHIDAQHPAPKGPHVGVHRPRALRDELTTRDFEI